MDEVYKVFVVEDGVLKTLFKGIEGSRIIRFNEWLEGDKKMSIDGPGQDKYLTGIHVFKEERKAYEYLDNFRKDKDRRVVRCFAEGLRVKPTNSDVYLADRIYVKKFDYLINIVENN